MGRRARVWLGVAAVFEEIAIEEGMTEHIKTGYRAQSQLALRTPTRGRQGPAAAARTRIEWVEDALPRCVDECHDQLLSETSKVRREKTAPALAE